MQTHFTEAQRAEPDIAVADKILRACVHCGFCTATCPTYVLLGDEADSPRGRIYLIKEMLEADRPADARTALHIDRCLSCLACMTTCPSGVHYMHLVDLARARIEETYKRPLADRLLRGLIARLVPHPKRFRLALRGAALGRLFAGVMPGRLKAMVSLAPRRLPKPSPVDAPQVFPAEGAKKARVALLTGCAQGVLAPQINEATVRLLTRHGCEVVVAEGAGCCGALAHHMGRTAESHAAAAANIRAWCAEIDGAGLDAVVINASGCGTTVKDYGFMFAQAIAALGRRTAARIAAITKRHHRGLMASVWIATSLRGEQPAVGWSSPITPLARCSMASRSGRPPKRRLLLCRSGLRACAMCRRRRHLCCGSAGTYNLLQPALATRLARSQGAATSRRTCPGYRSPPATSAAWRRLRCGDGELPTVVHTVELLDWATGGPMPAAIRDGGK